MAEKCRCSNCNRTTNHLVLKEIKNTFTEEYWEEITYQIIQCAGCEDVTFRRLYTDEALQSQAAYYNENPYTEELFPKRDANTRSIKTVRYLPRILNTIYRETVDTFNNGQYILCSAGLRALIEGICLDKKILGKDVITKKGKPTLSTSLESKIDGLSINRLLTDDNSKALHELRFLGNEALHELTPPDVEDLKLAIDIIELTLTNIYELGHKTRRLRIAAEARIKE